METKHPNLIKVGKIIREARIKKGLSQEKFAEVAQLGRTYVGRIERGEQNISIQNLIQIAIILQLEVSRLFPPLRELEVPYNKQSKKKKILKHPLLK